MYTETGKNRLDVDQKIFTLVVFGTVCAILLILLVNISINTSSGIRAYVAGEGVWAKAQKEAVIHLSNYLLTEDESRYERFNAVLRINNGDKIAREELLKQDYDYDVAFDGLLMGENHPEDIPDMIKVFRRFHWVPEIENAINIWADADAKISELVQFADSMHYYIQTSQVSIEQKEEWITRLVKLDHELTNLELRFSTAMGNTARMVNSILRWSTIVLGLTLIAIGIWLAYRFYISAKNWMQTLRESETKFKNVLSNSRDVLYRMNLQSKKYEYVSPALKNMLGYHQDEFLEGGVDFILSKMHPEDQKQMQKVVEKYESIKEKSFLPVVEFRLKDRSGNWIWVSNVRTLVRNNEGEPEAIVGSVRDISTQKEQEIQIKNSLKEKETLLQEIHHRVKNNLSIITSLLELQKEGMPEEVQNMLSTSQSRIRSIAKVHEKLYQSTTLSDIPLDLYIKEITDEIKKAYSSENRNISIQIEAEPVTTEINKAIPIALILNELINNAFKHAFTGLKEGTIRVSLKKVGDGMELIVANNGNKPDDDLDLLQSESLGMTLIKVLSKRINGNIEIDNDDWFQFKIYFEID